MYQDSAVFDTVFLRSQLQSAYFAYSVYFENPVFNWIPQTFTQNITSSDATCGR